MMLRSGLLVALAALALLLVPMPPSDAEGLGPAYASQLDENGRAVYEALSVFEDSTDVTLSISAEFPRIVLHDSEEDAKAYAVSTANDALAAKYLSEPLGIWLWDLPVKSVEVNASVVPLTVGAESQKHYAASSVSFDLTVPEKYREDVAKTIQDVKDKAKTFGGSVPEKAKAIAKELSGITGTDEEGTVSDLYDALVKRSSSSFGVAAAYTYLASLNEMESATVKGEYYGSSDQGRPACWNIVRDEGEWYAVDATRNLVMVGSGSAVETVTFSTAYSSDLDMKDGNSLEDPDISRKAYQYPDDRPFMVKHGGKVTVGLMMGILIACLLYAARRGY